METIVCVTELSSWSDNAVKYAYELALLMRARLILLQTLPARNLSVAGIGEMAEAGYADAMPEEVELPRLLAEIKQKTVDSPNRNTVKLQLMRLEQEMQGAIATLVQQEKVGLVIVGQNPVPVPEPDLTDNVSGTSLLSCPCPVLIVPESVSFKPLWKIVYATDLKREPAADCAFLLKLANLFNAELMLLHVLETDGAGAREVAIEELQKVYRNLPYKNISFYIEASESVEKGISGFVRANRADMVVLSSQPTKIWQHLRQYPLPNNQVYPDFQPLLIRQQSSKKMNNCRNNCA